MRNRLKRVQNPVVLLLYSHNQLYIHIYIQKHNDAIKTIGHSSLEKYTSHFIERVVCDWELKTEQRLQPLNSSGYHSLSFPFSWAAQPGAWGASLYWDMVLIPATFLQLTWNSYRWGYILIWRSTTSCERHNFGLNSTSRQSRSPLISWYLRPDASVIYTSAFLLLTAWQGRRSICNTITFTLGQITLGNVGIPVTLPAMGSIVPLLFF